MALLYPEIVPPEEPYDPELENLDEVENYPEAEPENEMDALGMTPEQYRAYREQQTIKYLQALAQFAEGDSMYTDQNGLRRVNPDSDRWASFDNPMQEMTARDDVLSGRYFENGMPRLTEGPIQQPDSVAAREDLYKYLLDQYSRQKWEEQPRRVKNIEEGGSGVQLGEALPYTAYNLGGGLWSGAAHPGQINPNFDQDTASEYIQEPNGVFSSYPEEYYDDRYSNEYAQFNQNQVNQWRRGY